MCRWQVMAEGGPDAAVEAPFIWIAQDLLAARAATAAERRQRCRIGSAPPGSAPAVMSPKEAGAHAARAVRQARPWLRSIAVVSQRSHVATWSSDSLKEGAHRFRLSVITLRGSFLLSKKPTLIWDILTADFRCSCDKCSRISNPQSPGSCDGFGLPHARQSCQS